MNEQSWKYSKVSAGLQQVDVGKRGLTFVTASDSVQRVNSNTSLFSFKKQIVHYPSHQIFQHMHEVLNVVGKYN